MLTIFFLWPNVQKLGFFFYRVCLSDSEYTAVYFLQLRLLVDVCNGDACEIRIAFMKTLVELRTSESAFMYREANFDAEG